MTFDALAQLILFERLSVMGLGVQINPNGTVDLKVGGLQCRVRVEEIDTEPAATTAFLTLVLTYGGTKIVDSLMGFGANEQAALLNGVEQLIEAVVVPFLELVDPGFLSKDAPTLRLASRTGNNYTSWDVVLGSIQTNDEDGTLMSYFQERPPFLLALNTVTAILHQTTMHWVKIYLCRYPTGQVDGEVRIDNVIDEDGFDELLQFVWPTEQSVIWFRQFSIILPQGVMTEAEFKALSAGVPS